jgi:hypothetical protein
VQLVDYDLRGRAERFGSFSVGQSYGEFQPVREIDWTVPRAERERRLQERGFADTLRASRARAARDGGERWKKLRDGEAGRWGARSAAPVLARYGRIEDIPVSVKWWAVSVRNAATLSSSLQAAREPAMLFKTLATLRTDAPTFGAVDELRWRGPRDDFAEMAPRIGGADMMDRARALANQPVRSAPPPA